MPAVLRIRVISVVLASLLAFLSAPVLAAGSVSRTPAFSAEALLLMDPDGKVLFAKNAENDRAPASLVKLMTLYLACEQLEAGKADLEELVTVSLHAATTARYRMGLRAGEHVPLRVLMEGVAIASANDAATALAERLAGDESASHAHVRGPARTTKHHAATRHTTKASLRTRATVQTSIVGSSVRSSSEAIASSRSTLTTSSFARARPPAAHAKREAPAGALPQQLPPVPLPERQDTTSSGQAGGGSGALLPLLLAALASALAIFGFQLLPRLLPRPAFRKPRRFSLPPWHPG
jgi:hypothetical protein